MSNEEPIAMNWVDETQCSQHSGGDEHERYVSIDAHMNSVKDYGYMGVSVMVDGIDDLPAAVAMMKAALDARPAEFQDPDESQPMPDTGDMDF